MLQQKLKIKTSRLLPGDSPWHIYKTLTPLFYISRFVIWFPRIIISMCVYFTSFLLTFTIVTFRLHTVPIINKAVKLALYANFRVLLLVLGIVKITTRRQIAKNRDVRCVVANHTSIFDPVLAFCVGAFSFVSKIEVRNNFIQRYIGEFFDTIYLERTERNIQTISDALKTSSCSSPVLLYPEGSTNRGYCLLDFGHGDIFNDVKLEVLSIKYSCFHVFSQCNGCSSLINFSRLTTKNFLSVIEILSYLNLYEITVSSDYINKEVKHKLDEAKRIFQQNLALKVSSFTRFDILINMAASRFCETDTLFINDEYICFKELRKMNCHFETCSKISTELTVGHILSMIGKFKDILKKGNTKYLIEESAIFDMFGITNKPEEKLLSSRLNYANYEDIEIGDVKTNHKGESGVSLLDFIICNILKNFIKS